MFSYDFQKNQYISFYKKLLLEISSLGDFIGLQVIFSKRITTQLLWQCYKYAEFYSFAFSRSTNNQQYESRLKKRTNSDFDFS